MAGLTDLRQLIRDHCNRPGTFPLTDALCDDFVNAAQQRLQQAHHWRGQELSWHTTYGAATDGQSLPSSFISELIVSQEVSGADPSAALVPMPKVIGGRTAWLFSRDPETLRDLYYPQVARPGGWETPSFYYYIWAQKLFVVPNPSETINVQVDYYGMVADLSTGSPTNFFTQNYFVCLKWGALVEAWAFLHEPERSASAEGLFDRLVGKAIIHDASTNMSGPPRQRGT